jgi:hypothetical protein
MSQLISQDRSMRVKNWLQSGLTWLLLGLITAHLLFSAVSLLSITSPLLGNSVVTYEALVRSNLQVSYELIEFVQAKTPQDAILLISPRWNHAHALYFFYPRKLFFGGADVLQNHPEIQYVVSDGTFPDFPIEGEQIMLDQERGLYRIKR